MLESFIYLAALSQFGGNDFPNPPPSQTVVKPLLATDTHADILEGTGMPDLQAKFAKDFSEGKFPSFSKDNLEKAKDRLDKNPFGESENENLTPLPDAQTDSNNPQWWDGKNDEQIAARLHVSVIFGLISTHLSLLQMTPSEFRKASDKLLKWMDDRMSDLDALYEQTLMVGRVTGENTYSVVSMAVMVTSQSSSP